MKKAIGVTLLAAAVSTSLVSAASAATTTKAAAVQVQQSTFAINYQASTIRTVKQSGETLVAVRDIAAALNAKLSVHNGITTVALDGHTVDLKAGDKKITVDGNAVNLSQPVKSVNGTAFIAVRPLVQGLGGTLATSGGQIAINTIKLLAGAENPRFVRAGQILVSVPAGESRTEYLIDAKTGKSSELLKTTDASDLIVAPNGAKAAYTDSTGAVYVIDLATKQSAQVSADTSIKAELVWAADSSLLYFLQGDKGTVIAQLDPANGTIKTILDDKVDYKSSLNVSPDGKKFTYVVTALGKVTSDATNVDEDKVSIDFAGTGGQVYLVDVSVEKPAAVKLTTTSDDKLFLQSADGSAAYYVSVPEGDGNASVVAVDKDAKASALFGEGDVLEIALSGGKLYVLTQVSDSATAVYEVDPASGAKTKLYDLSGDVSGFIANGSEIAVENGGQVYARIGDQWKPITK
ncbi:stalk domain-containing protein [Cohnella nanjingensis]|nr:stalk domain-containing protein [Cohnella nanjingensis]